MKTAEEILKKHCKGKIISQVVWADWDVLRAMEEYAGQFKNKTLSEEVKEVASNIKVPTI